MATVATGLVAAVVIGGCVPSTAHAHPGGLHNWPLYREAKLADAWEHPPDFAAQTPTLVAWGQDRAETLDKLRAEWRRFDARYWASLEPAPQFEPSEEAAESGTGAWTADWYAIKDCESSGYGWNNVPGYYEGGLQFDPGTWDIYAPEGFPSSGELASVAQQIAVGEIVLAAQGPTAWANCFQ